MTFFSSVLDYLFPLSCVACGTGETLLCSACNTTLRVHPSLSFDRPAPFLDRVSALWGYEQPLVSAVIYAFKYQGITALGEYLAERLTNLPIAKNSCLVPIPLHPRKQCRRGFNQSAVLATAIARGRGGLVDTNLRRIRYSGTQTALSEAARADNVRDAFRYKGRAPESIILIDDVATTFSTLNEAARILRAAGAKSVSALVVAKSRF